MYTHFIKPVIEWILAFFGLIILWPLILLIAVVLAFLNNRNIFFFQQRPGFAGKLFILYKFKTLQDTTDSQGTLLPDDQRQFRFGTFLRYLHLDELPQLINILRGDMSFIGPRPLLVEYLPYYSEIQRTRHKCKPGIIGLSQVSGGNQLSWPQRLRLDVFYVNHQSFAIDMLILGRTVKYYFKKNRTPDVDSIFSLESFIDYQNKHGK